LFRLRDFQFFPTAVTNLSNRRMTVQTTVAASHSFFLWWFLHLPAGQCSSPPSPWDLHCCQQRHPTSSAHRIGHRTVQISIRWTTRFGGFYNNSLFTLFTGYLCGHC